MTKWRQLKYSTLKEIAKSIAQDTARYRKLSPSIMMVSSKNSGILKTTSVDFDCTKLLPPPDIVPLTIIAIQNMMRFKHNSLTVGGSAKEKAVNNPQVIPFVDDGRDDIETAAANYNNTIRHSIQRQLGPTLSTKNKANILYRLLRGCNLWMFLAISSIGLHLYRNLLTINNIPKNSHKNDGSTSWVTKDITTTEEETQNAFISEEVNCGSGGHLTLSCAKCPQ